MSIRPESGRLHSSGTYGSAGISTAGLDEHHEPVDELVLHLNVAVTTCSIYPTTHPKATEAVNGLSDSVHRYLHSEGGRTTVPFSLLVVDDELAIDGKPWRRSKVLCSHLLRALERHSIQRLTAPPGIDPSRIVDAVISLTEPQGPLSSDSVEVGKLELLEAGDGDPTLGPQTLENRVDALRSEFDAFVLGKQPSYRPFSEAVSTFVNALSKTEQRVLINGALETSGDRLFRHSLGTAIGSFALASSLGISGDVLSEIVAGGLLHDTALLSPPEFTETRIQYDRDERERKHPVLAAARLAVADELPPLVFLIALQHHRGHDGNGFPSTNARLSLASAIVAVADAWDVIFNLAGTMPEPTRSQFSHAQLKHMAGTELHTDLVDSFLHIICSQDLTD